MIWLTSILWVNYTWFNHLLKWRWIVLQRLGFILLNYFVRIQIWYLIIWFELSLIPIFLLLLGYGNQSSRIPATFYFFLYTLFFSLPFLVVLLALNRNFVLLVSNFYLRTLTFWIFMLAFLVKLPVFGLHFWLPKVHVESPTLGRIILAAILLKTGRFGIYLILKWSKATVSPVWVLIGRRLITIIARIQVDVKKLIAFRRISHLNLILAAIFTGSRLGLTSFLIFSVTHGFVSSGIFYLGGVRRTNRRLIYYLKGRLITNWLIVLVFNFSHPLTHSILGERLVFIRLRIVQLFNIFILGIGGIFIIWFSVILWLNLKSQTTKSLTSETLILSWFYLFILIIWFNSSLFL